MRPGAGIFVTVNETDLRGRASKNIKRVRAVWQEDDSGGPPMFPLDPSMVIKSSPGHYHRYWLIEGDWPADEQGRKDFAAVMECMVATYGSDEGCKDISRVLRLPGYQIGKTRPKPHMVRIVEAGRQTMTRARRSFTAFSSRPVDGGAAQQAYTVEFNSAPQVAIAYRAAYALSTTCDVSGDHQRRSKIALQPHPRGQLRSHGNRKDGHGIEAYALGNAGATALGTRMISTARSAEKMSLTLDQNYQWNQFNPNSIDIGTLFHIAREHGWTGYVRVVGGDAAAHGNANWRDGVVTAATLRRQTFPPIKYVVPGLIPEGLSILAGRPKLGKSWMALDICIAVAAGRICLGDKKPAVRVTCSIARWRITRDGYRVALTGCCLLSASNGRNA